MTDEKKNDSEIADNDATTTTAALSSLLDLEEEDEEQQYENEYDYKKLTGDAKNKIVDKDNGNREDATTVRANDFFPAEQSIDNAAALHNGNGHLEEERSAIVASIKPNQTDAEIGAVGIDRTDSTSRLSKSQPPRMRTAASQGNEKVIEDKQSSAQDSNDVELDDQNTTTSSNKKNNPKLSKQRTSKRKKSSALPKQEPAPKTTKKKKSRADESLVRLALHRNPYFTCLDEEQIERFIDEAELVKDFRPGQAIIVEGPSAPRITAHHLLRTNSDRTIQKRTRLRRLKTNIGDVYGDDYFEGTPKSVDPSGMDDLTWSDDEETPAASSGNSQSSSYLYVIRNGKADVFYEDINPATLGPSQMFGEGGFLFGRNHSASVVAATDKLECFRVDKHTFVHKILPSQNMKRLYDKYATTSSSTSSRQPKSMTGPDPAAGEDDEIKQKKEKSFMTMDDFLEFFRQERGGVAGDSSSPPSSSSSSLSSIANAYQSILRGTSSTYHDEKNHITLEDFCFFHFLMARPDPEIDIAFILMDRSKHGTITLHDFEQYLEMSVPYFDRNSEFIARHFGQGRVIRANQFSQFLHDLQRELGKQAFLHRVQDLAQKEESNEETLNGGKTGPMSDPHAGYLPAETFIEVLKSTSSWRLPDGVIDRLESLYCKPSIDSAESTALASVRAGTIKGDSPKQVAEYSRRSVLADLERRRNKLGTRHFAYVDFIAFQDLLVQLPAICNLIERSCQIKKGPISPDDFKVANRVLGIGGRLSRQQVNIVFDLFDLDHDGYLSNEDAISVCGFEIGSNTLEAVEGRDGKPTFAPPPNYPKTYSSALYEKSNSFQDDGRSLENLSMKEWLIVQTTQFLLSSIAGGFGMFTVYPLDLIKTRMMNQRAPVDGRRYYYTSLDCFQKVVRNEGFQGLYRGLLPPLLAAGPEKMVKFTLNDMLRSVLSKDDGSSSSTQWLTEIISGGCAGACQLLVTNPLEIVKIRMQMQGETAKVFQDKGFRVPRGLGLHYMSFTEIVRDFGTQGLYKGAAACLLRDIPFGAIYFPAYAACMDYFVNREGTTGASSGSILLSGTLAAVPASLLTNPMDLVKTRLQVASRPGEQVYSGIGDCIRQVQQTEGTAAFFKGSFPRVARIAPQFGVSLFAYEKLSQLIGFRGIAPPTNAPVNPRDYRTAFSSVSSGIESKAIDAESLIENIGLFKPPTR